jgi:hypothetical protein
VLDNIKAREYHVQPEHKFGIVATVVPTTLYLLALQTEVSKASARKATTRGGALLAVYSLHILVMYEACPESRDTKVLNMCNIFNLQKRHCE